MYRGKKQRMWSLLAKILIVVMTVVSVVQTDSVMAATRSQVKGIKIIKPAIQTLALKKGETYKLRYIVKPARARNSLVFSSSKKSIVKVSKKGVLKARKTGKVTITVASKTKPVKKVQIKVTVYKKLKKVRKVTLSQTNVTLKQRQSLVLKSVLSPKKTTDKKVTYVTSDRSVAAVTQKGVVTAGNTGTALITAYAKDGRGAKAVGKVTVIKAEDKVTSGGTATSVPSDGGTKGTPSEVPDRTGAADLTPTLTASSTPTASPTPGTSSQPAQEKELPKITWNCLGDSITANAYVNHH